MTDRPTPRTAPTGLRRNHAAMHCGVSPGHFDRMVKEGVMPAPRDQLAEYAVSTNNKVLGAALLALNDRLPRRDRAFSSAELAERLVGPETKAMRDAIYNIRTAVQGVVNKNRALEAGKGNPIDTIKMGLRARNQENN